jgi:two-component system, OmpR family, sensor histidine kinase KdpD
MNTRRGIGRHVAALLVSAALVAVVTGAVFALRGTAPVLSLGVLYLFAVLPVAVLFGTPYAVVVSVASMLAFNFFFLEPVHTFALRDSENWVALAVYLVTAVVAGELAGRSRRRAAEAQQREREAAFLAEVSSELLEAREVRDRLKEVGARTAEVLRLSGCRIELESLRRPDRGEAAVDLRAGQRHVGRLFFAETEHPRADVLERIVSPFASLLAVALDRERFARTALEAEALRRSDAIKTAVLRSVSHDLRSPLTAIRAAAEGLERTDLELDARDRAELVDAIRSEAVRLERVVTNLIDLSRLEAGAARPRPEVWSADELIGRALEPLGAAAERVVVDLPADPPAALVDAAQIERALVNLIENALKFSSRADPVTITVERVDDTVVIAVHDRGPGLTAAELGRIFEPFERGEAGSTGLGLAIARGFAQANGGRVEATSRPGEGAVFSLVLPRADVPARVRV